MKSNPLRMKRFGPVTLYVDDAQKDAEYLGALLGMEIAFVPAGSEPIYGLQTDDVIFIVDGSSKARAEVKAHGRYISSVGIYVEDSASALKSVQEKCSLPSGSCVETQSTFVKAPHDGEVYYRFLEERHLPYHGIRRNESRATHNRKPAFNRIDHIVTNTQKMEPLIQFCQDVFGMEKVNEFTIRVQTDTFRASLYSEVMGLVGTEHEILFPVNEPLPDDNESQIPAQIREMGRSHLQHIALSTADIIGSIGALRDRGLGFLEFRNAEHAKHYYQSVPERLGSISVAEALDTLRNLGILVDKCGEGYLLQLFSKRIFSERSVPFIEIIQRASDVIGCFGDGNFAALAESLEHSMRISQS